MERDFFVEKQLDNLLQFFAEKGTNVAIPIHTIPKQFHENLNKMLAILEQMNLVVPMQVDFGKNAPTTFHGVLTLTPAGVYFAHNESFVENAKRKSKELKRFNFEYFTMGWDTTIAILSLIISAIALWFSTK